MLCSCKAFCSIGTPHPLYAPCTQGPRGGGGTGSKPPKNLPPSRTTKFHPDLSSCLDFYREQTDTQTLPFMYQIKHAELCRTIWYSVPSAAKRDLNVLFVKYFYLITSFAVLFNHLNVLFAFYKFVTRREAFIRRRSTSQQIFVKGHTQELTSVSQPEVWLNLAMSKHCTQGDLVPR